MKITATTKGESLREQVPGRPRDTSRNAVHHTVDGARGVGGGTLVTKEKGGGGERGNKFVRRPGHAMFVVGEFN